MNQLLPWAVMNASAALMNTLVFGFLGYRDDSPPMKRWALGYGLGTIGMTINGFMDVEHPAAPLMTTAAVINTSAALAFLSGSYQFRGRRLTRAWKLAVSVSGGVGIFLGLTSNWVVAVVPLVVTYAVSFAWAGFLIWREAPQRVGAKVAGASMILLALHSLTYPLVVAKPVLIPWGYLLAAVLLIASAIGMLMLYYEVARDRWVQGERALSQSRRLEALGRIAGGVAHDFNNLLTVMTGNLDLLDRNDPEFDEGVADIERAVEQGMRLTQQLLAFGRRSVVRPQKIDIQEVAASTLGMLRSLIPNNLSLDFHVDAADYETSADRVLLEQILVNLVSNARDAMPRGGTIDVKLSRHDIPRAQFVLEVRDTGQGIAPEVLSHVFEPFYTTKEVGGGTGLGLASVYGAVEQLGGHISVQTELGEGTSFRLELPCRAPTSEEVEPPVASAEVAAGRVLVVDDDEPVRAVASRMLRAAGHDVTCAASAEEALQRLEQAQFDVVLSDVVMPGMGGIDLKQHIAALDPDLPVLLTSGYPRTSDRLRFIPKPFARDELTGQVNAAILRRRARVAPSEQDAAG